MVLTYILKYPSCDGSRDDGSVFYSTLYEVHGEEKTSLSLIENWEHDDERDFDEFKQELKKIGLTLKEVKMHLIPNS